MSTLTLFETMNTISASMVEAAAHADWERLVALERDVAGLRDRIAVAQALSAAHPIAAEERLRKVGLIHDILANDRRVREYTEPWLRDTAHLLASLRPEPTVGSQRRDR